jgi:Ca-activated chloride channel family protein
LRKALLQTVEEVKAPPPPVVENPGTAELKGPESVPAGAAFSVQWKGPDSRGDYISIAEKASKDLEHKEYAYTKRGNPSDITAPGKVGDYELRYIHAQSQKVIGRAAIKITPVQAMIQAPNEADIASTIEVKWQGPAYPSDYITIARPDQDAGGYLNYTYTKEGSPLTLQTPSEPGTYEVRYILGRAIYHLPKPLSRLRASPRLCRPRRRLMSLLNLM